MGDKPTVPPAPEPPPPGPIELVLCMAQGAFGGSAPFGAVYLNIVDMYGVNGTDPQLDEAATNAVINLGETAPDITLDQMKAAIDANSAGLSLSPELDAILRATPQQAREILDDREAPLSQSQIRKTRDAIVEDLMSQTGMPNPAATVNDAKGMLGTLMKQAAMLAGSTGADLGKFTNRLASAIPNQERSGSWNGPETLNFMGLPLSDVREYMGGDILSAKLKAAEQLELHFWLAGDMLNNLGGLVLYKYSDLPERTEGEGWLDEWNLNEVITVSVFHAAGLDELLKQATIKDPNHPLAPSTVPVSGVSPINIIFRHRQALMGGFYEVLRSYYDEGRTMLVANLDNESQLFEYVLNDAGFTPVQESNGYTFRTLSLTDLFSDSDPIYKEIS